MKNPTFTEPTTALESMRLCPKFDSCSAPTCPLDPDWELRDMTRGDATCIWLREMVKEGTRGGGVAGIVRLRVAQVLPAILSSQRVAPLRAALKRAAGSGSKRDAAVLASLHTQPAA